jgi:hypothetical protein
MQMKMLRNRFFLVGRFDNVFILVLNVFVFYFLQFRQLLGRKAELGNVAFGKKQMVNVGNLIKMKLGVGNNPVGKRLSRLYLAKFASHSKPFFGFEQVILGLMFFCT